MDKKIIDIYTVEKVHGFYKSSNKIILSFKEFIEELINLQMHYVIIYKDKSIHIYFHRIEYLENFIINQTFKSSHEVLKSEFIEGKILKEV